MWGQDWGQDRTAIAAQMPKPRVVQHRGRRYSIRLESVFWKFLEYLAGRQGVRLGRYIARGPLARTRLEERPDVVRHTAP